jgi:ABC-2 type transport system ATP-binding protein
MPTRNDAAQDGALAPAVVLDNVTRRFRATRAAQRDEVLALDRVSLVVESGDVFGLLGPNGAGKTTLLRLASTLLVPSAGRVVVLGYDVARQPEPIRRRIGAVLGGERSVYWRLTARENLLYAGALHDLPAAAARERAAQLLTMVGLADRADDLVERYSTGMRQRLALARALVHNPALLILDEPTAGLDPQSAAAMRTMLEALGRDRDRTIVVATHNLVDAERLCRTVAIIDRGRLLAAGAPSALKARWAGDAAGAGVTLEDVFLAMTGRSIAAADAAGPP